MAHVVKTKWVYFSLFFLSRAMHINKQEETPNVGKKKAERSQPVDRNKARWCISWIFFSPIYLRVNAGGICYPGICLFKRCQRDPALHSQRPRKREPNKLEDVFTMWPGRIKGGTKCP
jgi:hypothetical protein